MKTYLSTKIKAKGADVSKVINDAIEKAKYNTTLVFPEGEFNLTSPIFQTNKTVHWEGVKGKTTLIVRHKETGITITRNSSTGEVQFDDIHLLMGFNGHDNFDQHGISCSVPIQMNRCQITGFYGNGLNLWGDTTSRPGTDVSHAAINYLTVDSCKGDGVFIQGGDSNGIVFYRLSTKDNGKAGYRDTSLLGCHVIGGMGHNNKEGHFRIEAATSEGSVISSYGEGDSPPSWAAGSTFISGGIHENKWILNENAVFHRGKVASAIKIGSIEITKEEGIHFGKYQVTNGIKLNEIKTKAAFPHYGIHHMDGNFHQFFAASKEYPADYSGRQVPFASSGFQHLFIGDRLFITATKDEVVNLGLEFKNGDTIFNSKFDGTNAERWVFVGSDWKEIKI